MSAAITYSAPNAAIKGCVRSYRTLDHARGAYAGPALKTALRHAQALGKTVTVELWQHWGTRNAKRLTYREVDPS